MRKREEKEELGAVKFLVDQIANLPAGGQREIAEQLHSRLADTPEPLERIVSMKEAAKAIGKTTRTVQNLISEGLLVAVRPSGRARSWGVSSSSLELFIRDSRCDEPQILCD